VLEAASARLVGAAGVSGGNFQAGVAMYPPCQSFEPGRLAASLLLLLGGTDDEEPPGACVARAAQLKRQGEPIDWHIYSEATHSFDTPGRDHIETYQTHVYHVRYDADATQDAHVRIAAFLAASKRGGGRRGAAFADMEVPAQTLCGPVLLMERRGP